LGLKGKIRNWTVSLLVLTSKSISTLNLKWHCNWSLRSATQLCWFQHVIPSSSP
jgi:hypothetical protein